MAEERITEVEDATGDRRTTHTTIVSDEPRRGSGGILIAVVLLVALVVGIWAFSQMSGAEIAKDDAIAGAANEVGEAAQSVGDAAQDAADSINN